MSFIATANLQGENITIKSFLTKVSLRLSFLVELDCRLSVGIVSVQSFYCTCILYIYFENLICGLSNEGL